jgi:hypothetical protein
MDHQQIDSEMALAIVCSERSPLCQFDGTV